MNMEKPQKPTIMTFRFSGVLAGATGSSSSLDAAGRLLLKRNLVQIAVDLLDH